MTLLPFARLRPRAAGIGLLLGAVLASPGAANAPVPVEAVAPYREEIAQESAELEKVRAELRKAREEHGQYQTRESQVLSQLNGIDSELTLKERLVSGLRRKEERLSTDLVDTRDKLQRERERLEERRDILTRRLRNIYKVGERPGLQVLLGATSAVDLVRRFEWLLLVADQDRRLYDDVQVAVARVRETEAELNRKQDEVAQIRDESESERSSLESKRQDRQKLLSSVRTEKQRRASLIGELEQAEKDMQTLLEELEARAKLVLEGGLPPEGTGFEERKGKLPWPVHGKVTRWFGVQKDKRFGTSTFNGGIDIEAAAEADVIAVHTGRADYVNWLPGYGQCIILNHGGGYFSLYAHTSKVFVAAGDLVNAGAVIATVGDTGSLLGNVLHFEIRKDAE
ncbi:peptidoglycan DD-metalloendopeptidase family protein, partial [bacterium]|nr:peptidoglycan DD-metalloendopeptidase family protein [bacterium]